MEFKFGEAERGRTIFEGVMSNYPKRVDLWSIYLDMEIRAGEQDIIRWDRER
jgi:rRNA biogenesis protein RRP5